jgi:hypothetical protein
MEIHTEVTELLYVYREIGRQSSFNRGFTGMQTCLIKGLPGGEINFWYLHCGVRETNHNSMHT